MMKNKIFGIGLSRTATTSLANALKEINIDIIHYPTSKAKMYSNAKDGACDLPVAVYYKELDKKFPNSKFIYTIREKEGWLDSIGEYLKNKEGRKLSAWHKDIRTSMYGQVEFDRKLFSLKYDTHDKDVKEYFKEREADLLIINICNGEGWEALLPFLGVTNMTPNEFPHKNKKNIR